MALLVVALLGGAAVGMAAGGDPDNLARRPVQRTWLLVAGVALQLVGWATDAGGATVLVGSYTLLLAFAVANLSLIGMPVVAVGLALNALVIGLNGAMPVREDAAVAAGVVEADGVGQVDLGPKRRLERPDDRLALLGDTIPVAPLRAVFSFGDLVLAAGLADVAFRLLLPRRAGSPVASGPEPRR